MRKNLYVDVHVIQTIPPSNINRDDTGSPKTAVYGGVTRSRVSSQSWKKAMRTYFNEAGSNRNVGIRSLDIPQYIADKIMIKNPDIKPDEALKKAVDILTIAKIQTKDNRTKALLFLGDTQAEQLAEAAINGAATKESLQEIIRGNIPIDIALFGRMVADDASLNEDASSQVAHAISTHAVQTEYDFYTAVDDLSKDDQSGAGMLGTIEYNSSTLYRYANVAVHELIQQLDNSKESTRNTVKLFIESFVNSLPTGKVNTFANQTLPNAVVVVLREDRPVNVVNTFETPIKSNEGYVTKSIEKLVEGINGAQAFVEEPLAVFSVNATGIENGADLSSMKILLERVESILDELIIED